MRGISTLFEIILSVALLLLGLYALQDVSGNKSNSMGVMLILGAACITLGVMTLISAFRSILWRRHMLRHSAPNHHLNGDVPKHNHG